MKTALFWFPFVFFILPPTLRGQSPDKQEESIEISSKQQRYPNRVETIGQGALTAKVHPQRGLAVAGRTPYTLGVTQSGGAHLQIPLVLPKGIGSQLPNMSLQYNSQAGDGIAGWGWSLGGLSRIARVGATLQHDGFIDPVDLDTNDRFALDGQRLLLKSGAYGKKGPLIRPSTIPTGRGGICPGDLPNRGATTVGTAGFYYRSTIHSIRCGPGKRDALW